MLEAEATINSLNTLIKLYNAPMKAGIITDALRDSVKFVPHWRDHSKRPYYLWVQWIGKDDGEFETHATLESLSARTKGIIHHRTYYKGPPVER